MKAQERENLWLELGEISRQIIANDLNVRKDADHPLVKKHWEVTLKLTN